MKILKHSGKILKHSGKILKNSHHSGGSINHLIHTHQGGNISELKKQLKHLVIKPKSSKIKF